MADVLFIHSMSLITVQTGKQAGQSSRKRYCRNMPISSELHIRAKKKALSGYLNSLCPYVLGRTDKRFILIWYRILSLWPWMHIL